MAVISTDTFTEASDVALESHTSDTGQSWSKLSTSGATVNASVDKVKGDSTTTTAVYTNSATPASADYSVEAKVKLFTTTSTSRVALCARLVSENVCYTVQMAGDDRVGTTQNVKLWLFNTTATQLGSTYGIPSWVAGSSEPTVKLDIAGDAIKVYIDGVVRISATNSTLTAAGNAGIRLRDGGRIDDLVITDTSTSGVAPGSGSLTVGGSSPSLSQPHSVAPSAGAISAVGYAPDVSQARSIAPSAGAISAVGYAPDVSQARSIAPSAGAISAVGYAPDVSQARSIAPSAGGVVVLGYAPVVTTLSPMTVQANGERMNFNAASTVITSPSSTTPAVALRIYTYANESYTGTKYSFFYGGVSGATGKTPAFTLPNTQVSATDGYRFYPLRSGFAPYFSEDGGATWTAFANSAASGNNWVFSHSSAFTADSVLISFYKPLRISDFLAQLNTWQSSHPSLIHYTTSGAGTFTVATAENYTNGDGSQTGQPFYGVRISDDSASPVGGKRNMVVTLGTHPDEDVSHWLGLYGLDWLVTSGDAKALNLLEFFNVFVYWVNPNGRTGGGLSGSFDSAHPTYNCNRRWLDGTPPLDIQTKLIPVITTDTGGSIRAAHDFHSAPNMDTSAPSYDLGHYHAGSNATWDSAISAYIAELVSYYSSADIGNFSTIGTFNQWAFEGGFGASMSIGTELAQEKAFTPTQLQNYGAAYFKAWSDVVDLGTYFIVNDIHPDVGTVAVSGAAPTISQPHTVAPTIGAATYAGNVPTITQGASVSPSIGAVSYTGSTPSISRPQTVAPAIGAATYAGNVPEIFQSTGIRPSIGAVSISGAVPSISQPRTIAPSIGGYDILGNTPTISQAALVTPTTGQIIVLGGVPEIVQPRTVAPTIGGYVLTGRIPVVGVPEGLVLRGVAGVRVYHTTASATVKHATDDVRVTHT